MHPHAGARSVSLKLVLICLIIAFAILGVLEKASGAERVHAPVPAMAAASADRAEAARTLRYWTPQRMESARPLELVLDRAGEPSLRFDRPAALAGASFLTVGTPEVPPYSFNGRIFIKVGNNTATARGPRSTASAASWC